MSDKSKPKNKPAAPFVSEDSEACFHHFSKLVADLSRADLEVWNADPEIVRVNVVRGVDAVRSHVAHIEKALPLVSVANLLELPSLALALGFAADRVFAPASPQEIRARQRQLRPMRGMTLLYLEIAAELGLVPPDRVAAIRADRGAVDEARDAVAIVALFRERADVLKNRHPFTEEQLGQLAADGNWLLGQLVPKGAEPGKTEPREEALTRDRLWTELVRRYDNLYQAGVAVWGRRRVDQNIPSLHARATTASGVMHTEKAPPAGAAPGDPASPEQRKGNR
jgi:hypothetical protein